MNDITSGVASFPIAGWIEILIQKRVRFDEVPRRSVDRTPNFVIGYSREMNFVVWVPAAEEPQAVVEHQCASAIARGERCRVSHLRPAIRRVSRQYSRADDAKTNHD